MSFLFAVVLVGCRGADTDHNAGRANAGGTAGAVVTLRGAVANDNERAQARLLAWTTQGVQRVDDALTVNPALDGQPPLPLTADPVPHVPALSASQDAALETAVGNELQGAPGITVTAKDGVILLDGVVPTIAAKQRIIAAARQTAGVVQVVDRLRVGK